MKLRRANAADAERLATIERDTFDPARYPLMPRRRFRFHAASPRSVLIVAGDEAGVVQGYALGLGHARRSSLRFYSLAVARDAQRGDYGRALFGAIEAEAARLGLGVQCEVREDNMKLRSRYEALGYRAYRTVPDYYPDGAACIKYLKPRERLADPGRDPAAT